MHLSKTWTTGMLVKGQNTRQKLALLIIKGSDILSASMQCSWCKNMKKKTYFLWNIAAAWVGLWCFLSNFFMINGLIKF